MAPDDSPDRLVAASFACEPAVPCLSIILQTKIPSQTLREAVNGMAFPETPVEGGKVMTIASPTVGGFVICLC